MKPARTALVLAGAAVLTASVLTSAGTAGADSAATTGAIATARAAARAAALPPLVPGDWTGARNKVAGGGVNSAETTITPANVAGLHVIDSRPARPFQDGGQAGATGHGLLFTGGPSEGISAFELSTGVQLWSEGRGSGLIAVGDSAVFTTAAPSTLSSAANYGLTAYAPRSGVELWHVTLPNVGYVSAPTVSGSVVLVAWTRELRRGNQTWVGAFRAATGQPVWQRRLPYFGLPSAVSAGSGVAAVTVDDAVLQALALSSGQLRWKISSSGQGIGGGQSRPVVRGNVVYAGLISSTGGLVLAANATTGAQIWGRQLAGAVFTGLVEDDGVVYVGPEVGQYPAQPDLFALNGATGQVLWSRSTGVDTPLTLANGVLYVGKFFGVDGPALTTFSAATGAPLGHLALAGAPLSEAMVSHGRVYLLEGDQTLVTLAP